MTTPISVSIELPEALLEALLQHLRDFTVAHQEGHMSIWVTAPDLSTQAMSEMLDRLKPPLPIRGVLRR